MKRNHLYPALGLTLAAALASASVACDRDDVPGVTTTTSATMESEPIDRSYVAQPPPLVPQLDEPEIQDEGRGRVEVARSRRTDRGTMTP
jgi:hypothetical protein